MKRLLPVLMVLLLVSCKNGDDVALFEGRYFVHNKTPLTLKVDAKDGGEFVLLENSQIAIGQSERAFTAEAETENGIRLSNFFTEFRIFVRIGIKDSVIYNRVRQSDWIEGERGDNFQEFTLEITP